MCKPSERHKPSSANETFSCGTINRLNDSNNNITTEQKIKRYIKLYAPIARKQMKVYKIPASVTMAQGILESGYGESTLAKKSLLLNISKL